MSGLCKETSKKDPAPDELVQDPYGRDQLVTTKVRTSPLRAVLTGKVFRPDQLEGLVPDPSAQMDGTTASRPGSQMLTGTGLHARMKLFGPRVI